MHSIFGTGCSIEKGARGSSQPCCSSTAHSQSTVVPWPDTIGALTLRNLVLLPIVLKPLFSGTACLARACPAAANVGTLTAPRRTCQAWSSNGPRLGRLRAQGGGAGQMHVNVPRRIFRTLRIVGGLPTALMLYTKLPQVQVHVQALGTAGTVSQTVWRWRVLIQCNQPLL